MRVVRPLRLANRHVVLQSDRHQDRLDPQAVTDPAPLIVGVVKIERIEDDPLLRALVAGRRQVVRVRGVLPLPRTGITLSPAIWTTRRQRLFVFGVGEQAAASLEQE